MERAHERGTRHWREGILLAVFTGLLVGCTPPPCFCVPRSTPVAPPESSESQLTFVNPKNTTNVFIFDAADGQLIATTRYIGRMTVSLPPGPRTLVALSRGSADVLQVNLAPGQHYYALIRFVASPRHDFAIRALSPRAQDWAAVEDYMEATYPIELDPARDATAVDHYIGRWERRLPRAMEQWEDMDAAHRDERTLLPTDAAPLIVPPT